jgi:hypothetical protein
MMNFDCAKITGQGRNLLEEGARPHGFEKGQCASRPTKAASQVYVKVGPWNDERDMTLLSRRQNDQILSKSLSFVPSLNMVVVLRDRGVRIRWLEQVHGTMRRINEPQSKNEGFSAAH